MLRVLDLTEDAAEWCGRILADLGAEVIRIEPPGGSPGRRDQVGFALRNANKAGVVLDLDDPAGRLGATRPGRRCRHPAGILQPTRRHRHVR